MFKRFDNITISNPICDQALPYTLPEDFKYYDKDGFELNRAEQRYYTIMGHPMNSVLNHSCWQETWFELDDPENKLILEHSMILHRCSYQGEALVQLKEIKKEIPAAEWLIQTKQKWGFDFALDAVSEEGSMYEVIHIEYDSLDYDEFLNRQIIIEHTIRHIDWYDAAEKIWKHRDEWKNLKSFAQNDWKSNFLIGWKKSEYTEKSLTLRS